MRKIFRLRIASIAVVISLGWMPLFSNTNVYADAADVFPSGPYTATLISEKILYPSLFGVASGLPVADVSGVQLSNGKIRAYVFAQNQGIVIADSSDGKIFEKVGNAFGGDKGQGMPRVTKLADGRFRMYNMSNGGISCSISSDGLSFTVEKSNCITTSGLSGSPTGLSGLGIVKLANGTYRAFFSDLVTAGTGPDPHQIYSATSTDGLNWTADAGIRVGPGAPSITRSAEHPTAVMHSDGSVTLFYFDNEARPGKDSAGKQNMSMGSMGLYYATSTDGGLTFTSDNKVQFPSPLPSNFGNDPDVFLDKDGSMILWGGGFDHSFGGYIGAVKLSKTSIAPTPSPTPISTPTSAPTPVAPPTPTSAPTPVVKETPAPMPSKVVVKATTITCIKGKLTKKVTGVNPKCPSGYKKK